MNKISENEERKIEDRLIKIEAAIHTIFKALDRYNDIISKMQTFVFLQNSGDHETMEIFLKLFTDESSAKQFSKI